MGWYGDFDGGYPAYVPVAERRRRARAKLTSLGKKGFQARPVRVEGRAIAQTFWGQRWCEHLESYADLRNRLERGRTYVRNGSVIHLEVKPGAVTAMVSGSEVYDVDVTVKALPAPRWKALVKASAGKVSSVVELLAGRLSKPVMEVLCHRDKGLFPSPREIDFECSCPDSARMCKHVAAVLYGVGNRLDSAPELLFTLRKVDGTELVSRAARGLAEEGPAPKARLRAGSNDLAGLFGIELADAEPAPADKVRAQAPQRTVRAAAKQLKAKGGRAGTTRPAATRKAGGGKGTARARPTEQRGDGVSRVRSSAATKRPSPSASRGRGRGGR